MTKKSPSKLPGLVLLGAVTGAHGLKGEVVLKVFTEDPEGIMAYGPLRSEDGGVTVEIKSLRPLKNGFAARLAGVANRSAAEALKGIGLYAPREALGEVDDEDEFFQADLIGLAVKDEEGQTIGQIRAVQDFGAGDLLEIALKGRKGTVLLPFTFDAVLEVDVAKGYIVVRPPEGLWDDGKMGPEEELDR